MRDIRSPFDGFRSPFGARGGFNAAVLFANGEPGDEFIPYRDWCYTRSEAGVYELVTTTGDQVARVIGRWNGLSADQLTVASRTTYNEGSGLSWLAFDGVDDFLVTGTITPGTDKVQVFAGLRLVGNAASGTVAETQAGSNGTFTLRIPHTAGGAGAVFGSRGTIDAAAQPTSGFPIGASYILSGIGDISGDNATLRSNGAQVAQSTANQGTGNYLAYPLYIGRRGGTSLPFNGNLYSLVVRFGPNLDAVRIGHVERYVAARTGVTL